MNPGSNVNTPRSRVRCEMSRHSGPMVPASAFSSAVLPEERFFSSYFVPMRLPAYHIDEARKPCTADRMNQAHASQRARNGARAGALRLGWREIRELEGAIAPRLRMRARSTGRAKL